MSAQAFTETLELERVFNASIERVFAAWTQPTLLAQWFGPEGFDVIESDIDCRPQGKYSITIETPDKKQIKHFGEYLEIIEPTKLIFTWILENQDCQGSSGKKATTIVELNFSETESGTQLKLRHEKLPDQTALDGHRFGWQSSFESLSKHLSL